MNAPKPSSRLPTALVAGPGVSAVLEQMDGVELEGAERRQRAAQARAHQRFDISYGSRPVQGAQGSRRPELAMDLARIVVASTDGLFLAHQINDDDWDPDDFVTIVVAIVEQAVAAAR